MEQIEQAFAGVQCLNEPYVLLCGEALQSQVKTKGHGHAPAFALCPVLPLCCAHGTRCRNRRSLPPHRRSYMEITGRIKKLLPHEGLIIMAPGTRIPVEDIVEVTVSSYVEKCRKKAY